jgi:lipid-A-disaccharide synthase
MKFFIIAGEPSGDARGAELVLALKEKNPSITFYGAGGPKMRQAGVRIDHDLVSRAFVGFTDIIKNLGFIKKVFDGLLASLRSEHPDGIILIDYPGFNLRFAKAVKSYDLRPTTYDYSPPIFYYISPQIWAWGFKRIHLIKKVVDQMIVVFPFEEELYRKAGIPVTFVGHPFLDSVKATMPCQEALRKFGLAAEKTTIALLPGSREDEVKRHLPVMLEAAQILSDDLPNLQFIIAKPETLPESIYQNILGTVPMRGQSPSIITSQTYDILHIADAAIVSSGSATLETALMNVPMVVIYKTHWLNYLFGRLVVKIPNIALVNVVAGKRIVPELIQHHATGTAIAKALRPMIGPVEMAEYVREELKKIRHRLGSTGAVVRAAEVILKQLV